MMKGFHVVARVNPAYILIHMFYYIVVSSKVAKEIKVEEAEPKYTTMAGRRLLKC